MAQNQVLLACSRINNQGSCLCSERCRNGSLAETIEVRAENNLCREIDELENFTNGQLDDMWNVTTQKLITGVSLHMKATTRAGLTSFGSAMSGVPWYDALQERERTRLCRRINQIKRIWDAWPDIVENLTRESIIYVDVRTFSLDKLEKAINFEWVRERNITNGPRQKKKDPVLRGYPKEMIAEIITAISNTGILGLVHHDADQVKLILKDIKEGVNDMIPN